MVYVQFDGSVISSKKSLLNPFSPTLISDCAENESTKALRAVLV